MLNLIEEKKKEKLRKYNKTEEKQEGEEERIMRKRYIGQKTKRKRD